MPTIFVSINAAGPSIERSTWLSAAKCIIESGLKLLIMQSSPFLSHILICSKEKRGFLETDASDSKLPA